MILGILNVTPDSFSDGGQFPDLEAAAAHGCLLAEQGAEIIDLGGESTRPGAVPVDVDEELRRVIPVLRALRKKSEVLISIDTSKAAVADAAMEAGADIINDVTALLGDPAMPEVAARHGAGVILTHMQGNPQTMQLAPHYGDVVREVADFLRQRMEAVLGYGMATESMAIDPGIGFGKTWEHNLALLRELAQFVTMGRPVLVGVSRKSFLARLAGAEKMEDRLWPGVALTSYGREMGARLFRVHEPQPHSQALRMTEAIGNHA